MKTPFEFVVSSLRATNADVTETMPLLNTLNKMGMPIYGMQPPTGYSTSADTWVNSAALLDRMNFALSLVNNRIAGTHFDAGSLLREVYVDDPYAAEAQLEQLLYKAKFHPRRTKSSRENSRPRAVQRHPAANTPISNNTVALLWVAGVSAALTIESVWPERRPAL